jgi:membrane protease YdiL (CAAX protease family)
MKAIYPVVTEDSLIQEPAYPTIAESWGILGWFLLSIFVVGVPVYLLSKVLGLPQNLSTPAMTIAITTGLLVFLRWKAGKRWQPLQLMGQENLWLYGALPVLVLAVQMVLSVLDFLHLPNWVETDFQKLMQNPLAAAFFIVVAAPVLEELLFRGVILRGLLKSQRPWVAIGQSALLFGVFHFNPAQSLSAGLMGLLLGWLYYRTRSLWVCMAVHALNNAGAFLIMWLGPASWATLSAADLFGSMWLYAGVLVFSLLVLGALLWRIHYSTSPDKSGDTLLSV